MQSSGAPKQLHGGASTTNAYLRKPLGPRVFGLLGWLDSSTVVLLVWVLEALFLIRRNWKNTSERTYKSCKIFLENHQISPATNRFNCPPAIRPLRQVSNTVTYNKKDPFHGHWALSGDATWILQITGGARSGTRDARGCYSKEFIDKESDKHWLHTYYCTS